MASITIHRGTVPLGGIVPIMSNLTGAHAIPTTGTVDSAGWMYCDGSAIPAGNSVSGTVPNLTGERFLVGSTTAGTTGGANATNLSHTHTSAAHSHTMPTHKHTMGTHTHTSAAHTHSAGGYYAEIGVESSANQYIYTKISGSSPDTFVAERRYQFTGVGTSSTSTFNGTNVVGTSSSTTPGSTGATDPGDTQTVDPGDTHSTTPSATGSSLSSSTNNRPLYISVQYLMRVI